MRLLDALSLCALCWGYSKCMQLTTKDKTEEVEIQLEFITLLIGQPEERSLGVTLSPNAYSSTVSLFCCHNVD